MIGRGLAITELGARYEFHGTGAFSAWRRVHAAPVRSGSASAAATAP
jgi:hypothetical protein